jgi:hypothetical protein
MDYKDFHCHSKILIHVDDRTVEITLEVGVQWITIIFPDSDAKEHFVTQLGDLDV